MTTRFTDFNKPFEYKCTHDEWVPAKFLCMRKNNDGLDTVILYDRGAYEYPTNVNSSSPYVRNKAEKKKFWTVIAHNKTNNTVNSSVVYSKPMVNVGDGWGAHYSTVLNIVEGEYEV